ncbi:hypothetical protein OsJ_24133 [Oryza sativa Japonica Group]|uniref:Serine/threonine-protein kinase 19 n=1 Tax=Oryza sativa subsp. japonica TaxID=39947 RepID=B9FX25_ORYSJ|nr:hypothetical protein OsJ_24133 [Oryza sativa Japonica Group]
MVSPIRFSSSQENVVWFASGSGSEAEHGNPREHTGGKSNSGFYFLLTPRNRDWWWSTSWSCWRKACRKSGGDRLRILTEYGRGNHGLGFPALERTQPNYFLRFTIVKERKSAVSSAPLISLLNRGGEGRGGALISISSGEGRGGDPEDTLTFSDTMIALQLMRTQFPKLEKVVTEPFILQSQLYSSVKDRTQVDRDLESLKKDKVLRVFKLNTGQDDHAIMFMDDYLKQMALAVKRSRGKDQDGTEVFGWFERYVIHLKLEVSIDQRDLFSLLSLGGDVTDKHITLLMNAGLLTRQLIDPNMYWFSIPSIGPVLKGLTQGRKEILSLLNRKKYKEMLLSSLEKTRLRFSPLDVRFHIRDLIGSGHIKTVQTPTGLLVRISKD